MPPLRAGTQTLLIREVAVIDVAEIEAVRRLDQRTGWELAVVATRLTTTALAAGKRLTN
jgi:hypothetical protein